MDLIPEVVLLLLETNVPWLPVTLHCPLDTGGSLTAAVLLIVLRIKGTERDVNAIDHDVQVVRSALVRPTIP